MTRRHERVAVVEVVIQAYVLASILEDCNRSRFTNIPGEFRIPTDVWLMHTGLRFSPCFALVTILPHAVPSSAPKRTRQAANGLWQRCERTDKKLFIAFHHLVLASSHDVQSTKRRFLSQFDLDRVFRLRLA